LKRSVFSRRRIFTLANANSLVCRVENGVGGGGFATQTADDFGGQFAEIAGEVGALEAAIGVLIIIGCSVCPNLIQMGGKLVSIGGFACAEIETGINDGMLGFERHANSIYASLNS
jgi:hypothetical protein